MVILQMRKTTTGNQTAKINPGAKGSESARTLSEGFSGVLTGTVALSLGTTCWGTGQEAAPWTSASALAHP